MTSLRRQSLLVLAALAAISPCHANPLLEAAFSAATSAAPAALHMGARLIEKPLREVVQAGAAEAWRSFASLFSSDAIGAANSADAAQNGIRKDACNYICIGNPGVGKSTLLNSMIGEVRFKSGVTDGTGLTFQLQIEELGNQTFMDTPGLSDIEMRKKAAEAIKEALQKNGCYKVFFVVTLESGRVRPDDITTMRLVLEAAPEISESYAVVINKVTKGLRKKMDRPEAVDNLLNKMFADASIPRTPYVHFNMQDQDMLDEEDVLANLSSATASFINDVPIVDIQSHNVQDIKHDEFEAMKEEYEKKLTQIEAHFQAQLQAAQAESDRLRSEIAKVREENEITRRALEEQIKESEEKLRETEKVLSFLRQRADELQGAHHRSEAQIAELHENMQRLTSLEKEHQEEQNHLELLREAERRAEENRHKELELEKQQLELLGLALQMRVRAIGNMGRPGELLVPKGSLGTVAGSVSANGAMHRVIVDWDNLFKLETPPRFLSRV